MTKTFLTFEALENGPVPDDFEVQIPYGGEVVRARMEEEAEFFRLRGFKVETWTDEARRIECGRFTRINRSLPSNFTANALAGL